MQKAIRVDGSAVHSCLRWVRNGMLGVIEPRRSVPGTASMPLDIIRRVRRDFGANARQVLEELVTFRTRYPALAIPRLLRCIVQAAAASPAQVGKLIALAHLDPRDVIMAGEYQVRPSEGVYDRVFDLSKPFGD